MTAVRRIRAAALPDLPDASWSNALLVGEELVMSGMTAHPATRQAAAGGGGGGGAPRSTPMPRPWWCWAR
ncbi:hypothetical protein PA6716_04380 [Pseudomonas aeruginosa]